MAKDVIHDAVKKALVKDGWTISDLVFNDFFQLDSIRRITQKDRLAILVVNTATEEVVQWIS
jgi:hypothetical protein